MNVNLEKENRDRLLTAMGMDTSGFGLITTFSLYDKVINYMGFLPRFFVANGFIHLAALISSVSVKQSKDPCRKTHQVIEVESTTQNYKQVCTIADVDPEFASKYISSKYGIIN